MLGGNLRHVETTCRPCNPLWRPVISRFRMKKRWLRPSPLAPEGATSSACRPMAGHPGPSAQGADGASSPHHSVEAGAKVSAKEPRSVSIPEDASRKLSDVRRTISSDVAVETSSSATSPALWQGVQPDWEHVAALLRKRLELMFLGQKRAPSRSVLEPFAVHSTLRYCEEVSLAVGRFWKAERALIKESFGPTTLIAEEEVRGYLAADGLGEPLLTAKQADDVGTRVRNGANKAVKERASAKEATRTAIRAATRHGVAYCGDDSATAVARALSAPYDLALPGSKRAARKKASRTVASGAVSSQGADTQGAGCSPACSPDGAADQRWRA